MVAFAEETAQAVTENQTKVENTFGNITKKTDQVSQIIGENLRELKNDIIELTDRIPWGTEKRKWEIASRKMPWKDSTQINLSEENKAEHIKAMQKSYIVARYDGSVTVEISDGMEAGNDTPLELLQEELRKDFPDFEPNPTSASKNHFGGYNTHYSNYYNSIVRKDVKTNDSGHKIVIELPKGTQPPSDYIDKHAK